MDIEGIARPICWTPRSQAHKTINHLTSVNAWKVSLNGTAVAVADQISVQIQNMIWYELIDER